MRSTYTFVPLLALLALAGCQTDGAATAAAKAKAQPATQADRLVRLADDIAARGETDTAIALYQRAAAMPDARTSHFVKAGEAYMRAGYTDEAAGAFRAALEKSPNDGAAMMGLGSAMLESGDSEAGIRALAQAAPLLNTSSSYNRLGVAQTFAGQTKEAQDSFKLALARSPSDLDIAVNMALAAGLDGQAETALPLVKQILASPSAQMHHKRNSVLIYGLVNQGEEIRSTPPTGLTSKEVATILTKARTIRSKGTVVARAKALGTILG